MTAVGVGIVTITATIEGKTALVTVTVTAVPVATVTVTSPAASLVVGATLPLSVTARDRNGTVLLGRSVAWSSSEPAVATVAASGVLTAVAAGTATITATIEGKSGAAVVTVVSIPSRIVSGQLYAPTAQAFSGLVVDVVSSAGTIRAGVGAGGSFTVQVPLGGDSVTVVVDAEGQARTYHPAWIRVRADSLVSPLRVVLVPKKWPVAAGTFAGAIVDINLEAAFTPLTSTEPWAGFYYRTHLPSGLPVWPQGSFPVRVAFDRASSTDPITATDSATVWSILRQMEADLGFSAFRPANFSDLPAFGTPQAPRGIWLRLDRNLTVAGSAGWGAGSDALILGVEVKVGNSGTWAHQGVMIHEMTHALGIGHTCGWRGVMSGCDNSGSLTATDVAYITLQYRLDEIRRANSARYWIFEAWQGNRVLEMGLAPAKAPYDK